MVQGMCVCGVCVFVHGMCVWRGLYVYDAYRYMWYVDMCMHLCGVCVCCVEAVVCGGAVCTYGVYVVCMHVEFVCVHGVCLGWSVCVCVCMV